MIEISKKIKEVLLEPIAYTHNFGRLVMGIVGFFFILFGLAVFLASWYEMILKIFIEPEKEIIALFVTIAEYYLISITFVLVGRSVIAFAQSKEPKPEDIGKLKEYLFAMVVSISGVAFINMILEYETPTDININILYVGLAIACVVVALGVYIRLGREKVREVKEEEKTVGEEEMGGKIKLSEEPKEED